MLLELALVSALQLAPADSISGTWQVKGDVVGNAIDHPCTFRQAGAVLTGSCGEGAALPIKGEVKDGRITFQYASVYDGQAITVVFSGTLASATSLKGAINVQPFDVGGEFTATPVPAKP